METVNELHLPNFEIINKRELEDGTSATKMPRYTVIFELQNILAESRNDKTKSDI